MTRVALLWHMHQPYYEDLVTREHILPWVRLHALKDYSAWWRSSASSRRSGSTFNLVPSLLVQLEAFAADRAHDRYLELGLKPADDADATDIAVHARRTSSTRSAARMIEHLSAVRRAAARGAATLDAGRSGRRGPAVHAWTTCATCRSGRSWPGSTRSTSSDDARVRGLVAEGRHFTEDDKALLRAVELELLNAVIPGLPRGGRPRADRDLDVAVLPPDPAAAVRHRHLPADAPAIRAMPRQRFVHPEDARGAARGRVGVPRAAVRPPARRAVAVGGLGLGRDGSAGRPRPASSGWRPTS